MTTWIEREAHRQDGLDELRSLPKDHLGELLHSSLTDDLRRKPWKGSKDPIAGHCYVASEVLHYIYPEFKPYFMRWEDQPHWYLASERPESDQPRFLSGTWMRVPFTDSYLFVRNNAWERMIICDPTRAQFKDIPDYEFYGNRKGFLTNEPSKRALFVLDRMMLAAMVGA